MIKLLKLLHKDVKADCLYVSVADGFDAKNVGLRTQKKLLSKMATKKTVKVFIDETSARVLDNLYKLAKEYSGNKKTSEKVVKDLIKIVIKIGVLYRNDQFTEDELRLAEQFKKKFRTVAMTVISFYEVDFSFDKNYLAKALNECSTMVKELIKNHLTEKSVGRVENVFGFFGNSDLLEAMFRADSPHRPLLGKIVTDLNTMMENNIL